MTSTQLLERWRDDTPGTAHRIHLNNAGAALMPQPVLDACREHLELEAEVGGYEAANARAKKIAQVYDDVGALIGAPPRNVAIVANATAAFIQAMSSFDFAPGDIVVTTRADYTSYQITYLSLAKRLGVVVKHAEELPEGGVDPQSVRELARDPKCRLVHVSWVPTHSGLIQDVESVGSVCEELGVPYLIDACQAVGQIPIDVAKLKCDYLSATARKFLRGPRGTGFLYASDRALARGDHPLFVDMRGARWISPDRYETAATAQRYEDWEFPYALVLGLGAAARYVARVGVEVASERAFGLARELRRKLSALDGVEILDRGSRQCAIVTAAFAGYDAEQLTLELARHAINTTVTLKWYGLLDLGEREVESALRISPHYYNTDEEIERCVDVLRAATPVSRSNHLRTR
ncbi:MAG TPA: aminotransferase class V-fold PLP-dependent enzyme [Gemmatimonadaceae bacterium]